MSLFFDRRGELLVHALWPLLGLCVILILMIGIVLKLRSWYRDDSGPAADRDRLLLQFRDLKRQGQITEDEYRSIRGRLADENAASPAGGSAAVDDEAEPVVPDSHVPDSA